MKLNQTYIILTLIIFFSANHAFSQKGSKDSVFVVIDSIEISNRVCKFLNFQFIANQYIYIEDTVGNRNYSSIVTHKKDNIVIHGNVLYDFSYRSYLDTPIKQTDVMQHFIQTKFDLLIKNKYPVSIVLTHRNSNSPFFRDATDIFIDFSQKQILDKIKSKLKADLQNPILNHDLRSAFNKNASLLSELKTEIAQLTDWQNSGKRIVEEVNEKERLIKDKLDASLMLENRSSLLGAVPNLNPSNTEKELLADLALEKLKKSEAAEKSNKSIAHLDSIYQARFAQNKKKIDSLKATAITKENEAKHLVKKYTDSVQNEVKQINSIKNLNELNAYLGSKGNKKDSFLRKADKILMAIRKIGIGRNWIDYSDLTVKHISLSGFNTELNTNNKLYFAVAAGRVNYRFRDFIFKNDQSINAQKLAIFRIGYGSKDKNNIIFTHYNGRKSLLTNVNNQNNPLQKVMGFSLEANYQINPENALSVEFAKSSYQANVNDKNNLLRKSLNFKNRANESFSIKLNSYNPRTKTKLSANYRKSGIYFQSFNLNPVNSQQESWVVKARQALYKNKLIVDAAVRKNDFQSPIALPDFNTKTIFKSLQLTFKAKKYPFLSVGYYPTSLLSFRNGNALFETQYNTLNAVAAHSYTLRKTVMSSNATYTQFFNNSSDTAFLYFNAKNFNFSQTLYFKKLNATTTLGYTTQNALTITSLEQAINYSLGTSWSLNGAIKYNKVKSKQSLIGSTLGVQVMLKNLGRVQLNYDKTYLPNQNQQLMPVDMGRLIYITEF